MIVTTTAGAFGHVRDVVGIVATVALPVCPNALRGQGMNPRVAPVAAGALLAIRMGRVTGRAAIVTRKGGAILGVTSTAAIVGSAGDTMG